MIEERLLGGGGKFRTLQATEFCLFPGAREPLGHFEEWDDLSQVLKPFGEREEVERRGMSGKQIVVTAVIMLGDDA